MNLYIVPVPVGNLSDITLRAIDVLREVDFIIVENTKYSLKLLNHLNIKKKLVSYYKHREEEKSGQIIKLLKRQNGALISDSGTPLISDPGFILVKKAIHMGVNVVSLPGPTAFAPALVASGINPEKFLFLGFPPRKNGELLKFLKGFAEFEHTLVFYESPRRTGRFLKTAFTVFGNRKFAIIKELSKKNEKIIRGEFKDLEKILNSETILGEIVVIIEGFTGSSPVKGVPELETMEDIYDYFRKKYNISKNQIKKVLFKKTHKR